MTTKCKRDTVKERERRWGRGVTISMNGTVPRGREGGRIITRGNEQRRRLAKEICRRLYICRVRK